MVSATAGRFFAVLCAVCYGSSLPLSRMAFDEGTNALTVAMLRYIVITALLGTWVLLNHQRHRSLDPRARGYAVLLGVAFAAVSFGTLLGATFMAVSLTVLVFYTYPSLVLITAALVDRRRPRVMEVVVLVMAFLGLALALNVSLVSLSAAGIACGALAAVAALATFLIIERPLAHADALRSTVLAAVTASLASWATLSTMGEFALPRSSTGWLLLTVVVTLFATAVVSMFLAIRFAGSIRASMLLFLEPVTAMALSVALLGERLDLVQWLGAALVIAAVVMASLQGARARDHPV